VTELTVLQTALLIASIGLVAFLYSSVGHGGATGYLAAGALLGLAPAVARPGALWMNCCVAGIAFWRFQRAGYFDLKVFWPLAAASIPCAWLGSHLHLQGRLYGMVLGSALLIAGAFLIWRPREKLEGQACSVGLPVSIAAGGALGFLAGMTGIGGGVFLTPFLILLNWTPAKVAGGISALFIVVNSVAGLVGLGQRAFAWQPVLLFGILVGILGALLGTHFAVNRWRTGAFRGVLAVVLWIAAGKLFFSGN
jgi:uncharacterized membrane protein YfcA